MLNAFRHHGERDRVSPLRCTASAGSAQRLSASRRAGPAPSRGGHRPAECSTPFGITASGTQSFFKLSLDEYVCSTPFGITASGTRSTCSRCAAKLCSTPFGITASGTCVEPVGAYCAFGAQRLSASRRAGRYSVCLLESPGAVLNAFRHHGERDFTGSSPRGPGSSVLNAFRHHGERDELKVNLRTNVSVLNAFRHHGERDNGYELSDDQLVGCSTPFGITASGTSAKPRRRSSALGVLNAFRHHGERDLAAAAREVVETVKECSTPFGITASGTSSMSTRSA